MRWPARPAACPDKSGELRAGLDFFGSFCIKAKRTQSCLNWNERKFYVLSFACAPLVIGIDVEMKKSFFLYFLLLAQKKVTKKSAPPMIP